jgi:uncharacterized protein (TIGR02453 family)
MTKMPVTNAKPFAGFTKETVRFFNGLKKNNTKEWFEANRTLYDEHVMAPARAFVVAMGERLRSISPKIIAVPLVNKSIFRINRDTRFSADPSPYKTNLGLYFWEGLRPRMESSGFYFHLEPPEMWLGVGLYMFTDALMTRFRRAAVHPESGPELSQIVEELSALPGVGLGGQHYKRVPVGYDPEHPNAELLKHNGLYSGYDMRIPDEFFSPRLVEYCFERFEAVAPLHRWIVKYL